MKSVYFLVSLMSDKSQYYSSNTLSDCITFIREHDVTCFYKWRIRILDVDSGKCYLSCNLGSFYFG